VWHDSFASVTWLIRMCDMTHSQVWRDSFVCVTWLIRKCDVTHSYVCHDSFILLASSLRRRRCSWGLLRWLDPRSLQHTATHSSRWRIGARRRVLLCAVVFFSRNLVHLCVALLHMCVDPLHMCVAFCADVLGLFAVGWDCLWMRFGVTDPTGRRRWCHRGLFGVTTPGATYVWHDWCVCVTWLIHTFDMTHSNVWRDSFICVTRLIHVCDMTHSYVWHDSFICLTWLIHMCDMPHSYMWHDSFIYVTWLNHMCDMTHLYVRHDSFICVTWLIHMCDITQSYMWHDSFICVTWLIHMCDMTHSCVWRNWFICATWLIHTCDMTHSYTWHTTDAPDVLAHISVRARNLKVLFATCFDADEFESLARFVGKKVRYFQSYLWHDSFTWLIYMLLACLIPTCDMTHSYVWHDSFTARMTHEYV